MARNDQTTIDSFYSKQSDAIELKQKEEFEKLGADIQHFVSQYALGHKKLHELVRSDIQVSQRASAKTMKAHVTEEIARSQAAVFTHIDSQVEVATEEATRRLHDLNMQTKDNSACDRLLRSLKYTAMNERRNHLTDSHEGTFKWIFHRYQRSNDVDNDVANEFLHPEYKDNGMSAPQYQPWDDFEDWLKSDSNIYWISGKPGSGKSTLMKFLISNPLTKEALRTWRSDVLIISHFFWKPGSMAQKNVRGLFASLLHQLLNEQELFVRTLLASSRDFQQKDSETDWSTIELRSLCLSTMRSYPSSICVFLDGLDEICDEDGVHVLMEIVDTFKTISGVKICVSSRPEQRFKLYLSHIPQLKVHDLTYGDMSRYAAQTLSPFWKRRQDAPESLLDRKILPELLQKAQGVFLWIRLAVRNLITGLESGDSVEEMILRLRDLPSELSQMYADMWKRVNENSKVHRESTAKLLNLIIDYRNLLDHTDDELWEYMESPKRFHVIDIMGATDATIQKALFVRGQKPTTEAAIHSCIRARGLIEARCIGLVDTIPREGIDYKVFCETSLRPHALPTVEFIHRTAYDFLIDTEEGRHILSYDSSSNAMRYSRLFRGLIVAAACVQGIHSLSSMLEDLARASRYVSRETTYDLLEIFWRLYNRDLIEQRCRGINDLKQHFLCFVTSAEFRDLFVESINRSPQPSALATEVLRDIVVSGLFKSTLHSGLGLLLSLGADPILKGRVHGLDFLRLEVDGSAFTTNWLVLQGIIQHYVGDGRPRIFSNRRGYPGLKAAVHELTKFYWNHKTASAEPLRMSLYLDKDTCALSSRMPESDPNLEVLQREQRVTDMETYLVNAQIIVEAKAAFWLEVIQRRQKVWGQGDESPALPTAFMDQVQDHSSLRIRYFFFERMIVDREAKTGAWYRVKDQESMQHIEQTLETWLFDQHSAYKKIIWNGVTRAHNDFIAGSKVYERVYGKIREHFADEGLDHCRVSKEEIYQRAQHMREEDPDAPGHWL